MSTLAILGLAFGWVLIALPFAIAFGRTARHNDTTRMLDTVPAEWTQRIEGETPK